MAYFYLIIAIIAEVCATSALKASNEFTKLYPSLIVVIGYSISIYFMALVLKTIPIGITYAVWSGMGIVCIAVVGVLLYQQIPDTPAVIGMGFIIVGVVVIQVFSKTIH